MMSVADEALYVAKNSGRDKVMVKDVAVMAVAC